MNFQNFIVLPVQMLVCRTCFAASKEFTVRGVNSSKKFVLTFL